MNIRSFARAALVAALGLLQLTAASSSRTSLPAPDARSPLLQFVSQGQVLGFGSGDFYISSGSYALHVEFLNAHVIVPISDIFTAQNKQQVPPLNHVEYANLWDGITVTYDSVPDGIVRNSYRIQPRANPTTIRLRYNTPVILESDGRLNVAFATGQVIESAPVAWQEIEGERIAVNAAFVLYGEQEVGFALAAYDTAQSLFIDPTLTWNTFMGGGAFDRGNAVAVDGAGNVYVAGTSKATWGTPGHTYSGGTDTFVAKMNSTGAPVWNTFLGGSGDDYGDGIAADGSGNVYVAGTSTATWGTPLRAFSGGIDDAFAAKLSSTGVLTWNTFLGGGGFDNGSAVAVDGTGNVYLAGASGATWDTPVSAFAGGFADAFAAKLDPSGNMTWNTFLGGNSSDYGNAIAVDAGGIIYVAGQSGATWGNPVAPHGGGNDAFAAKLDTGGHLTWNTFMGGTATHEATAVAVDGSGNVYAAGDSDQTWGTPVRAFMGNNDAFAAKLDSTGKLTWNTFLGGTQYAYGHAISVDQSGNVYTAGESSATWETPVRPYTGGYDAFAAKLNSSGGLLWNTFLGQSGDDFGGGVALDTSGNAYVAGYGTGAWGCSPTACTVRAYSAGYDAFAAKLSSSGALSWNAFLGGSGVGFGNAIAVDGSGNVYIVGRGAAASFGANPQTIDAFVAKLNSSGVVTWKTYLGIDYPFSPLDVFGNAIALDGSGNVYVAGDSDNVWGSPIRLYTAGKDAFVAKLDSNGQRIWNTFLGGIGNDFGEGIALDGSGNVYAAGYSNATWQGSVPPVHPYTAGNDAFLAKLNSSGGLVWNTFLGGTGDDQGAAIAADTSGNSYVAGSSTAPWGTPVHAFGGGASDGFAAKLDTNGNLNWGSFLGGSGTDYGRAITVDGNSNVYVAGASDAAWGSPVHAYTAGVDAFVGKLNSSGGLTWHTFLGGSGNDFGNGIAVDASGNIYMAGTSSTTWGSPFRTYSGGLDAFTAKLGPSGALGWNAFLGGTGDDYGNGIALDRSGNLEVVGDSAATWGTPMDPYSAALNNAFLAKITIGNPLFLPFIAR